MHARRTNVGQMVMATERQFQANRVNAQKSTGPRTSEGKKASSMNALKHGLSAHDIVLFDEEATDFEALYNDLVQTLEPHGALEELLVERIATSAWRLRRVLRIEKGLMAFYHYDGETEYAKWLAYEEELKLEDQQNTNTKGWEKERLEAFNEEKRRRAAQKTHHLRNGLFYTDLRWRVRSASGPVFDRAAGGKNTVAILSRYESTQMRMFHRAMRDLAILQSARLHQATDQPIPTGFRQKVSSRP